MFLPPWKSVAELRRSLCPDLEPYYSQGRAVGVSASLGGSLRLQLQRLLQTGQLNFIPTVQGSLTCDTTLGLDGRGSEKVKIEYKNIIFF